MSYYDEKIYLAKVDKNDKVIGRVERWQAHEKGILHRAFTICLFFQDKVLLQHRKHPVFDDVFDLACSSHPVFSAQRVQDMKKAVDETLAREWGVFGDDFAVDIVCNGHVYYHANDSKSIYKEHEVCHLYTGQLTRLPSPNLEYAYGYSLMEKAIFINKAGAMYKYLAPWVIKLLPLLD